MQEKIKVERAKEYFKEEIKRFVSFYHYWNRYSFSIYKTRFLSDLIPIKFPETLATIESKKLKSISKYSLINYGFDHRSCFGRYLEIVDQRGYWGSSYRSRFVWTPYTKLYSPEQGNFTWMTKEMLIEHLNYPKDILGLNYDVNVFDPDISGEDSKGEHWNIVFDFKKLTFIEIKFVLFWARYAAEVPSCLALIDALILKEKYRDEELYNLLIMASFFQRYHFKGSGGHISDGQSISIFGKFISRQQLINRLKESPDGSVNLIFERTLNSTSPEKPEYEVEYANWVLNFKKSIPTIHLLKPNSIYDVDLNLIFDDENISIRLSEYEKLYSKYKSEEIK